MKLRTNLETKLKAKTKTKLKTLSASILLALSMTAIAEEENISVFVNNDNGKVTKKVIRNGEELSQEQIKELEESGELNKVYLKKGLGKGSGSSETQMIVIGKDGSGVEKTYEVLEKEVFISRDDNGVKKIIIDGKELSQAEIKDFKASDEFKILQKNNAKVASGKNNFIVMDVDADSSMNFHEFKITKNLLDEEVKSVNSKKFIWSQQDDDPNRGRLGFMANAKDDGWHVTSVSDNSGAKDAGLQAGDIVTEIAGQSLVKSDDGSVVQLRKHEVGEFVTVQLLRDGVPMNIEIEARALKDFATFNFNSMVSGDNEWMSEISEDLDFSGMSKVVFINNSNDFSFDYDDLNIHFPDSLKDLNVFVADGRSTSKLLGKRHKFTSMSGDLSQYFGTKAGVLVLNVDKDNVFGLKDGDVIQRVNDDEVDSPKSIIKRLLKAEEQQDITLQVVRHKKTKTLKAKM